MRLIAQIASIVFHPLLLTSYAATALIVANPDTFKFLDVNPDLLLIRVVLNTVLLPAVALLLIRALGFVSSITLYDRMDRTIPYVAGMFFYAWTTVSFFMDQGIPDSLRALLLGTSIGLALCFFTNILMMKVSLHTTGVAAFMVYIMAIYPGADKDIFWVLLVSVLATGLVGSSRLILQAHNRDEVYAGYLIGMVSMLLALRFV